MFQNLAQKYNQNRIKKTYNFEKIATLPAGSQNALWPKLSRFFSVIRRIFPKRKIGSRKQRRLRRLSPEKKFNRLIAATKVYTRKTKLKKFIWDHKYGAPAHLGKSLLISSWAQKNQYLKGKQNNKKYKRLVDILKLDNRSLNLQFPKKWQNKVGLFMGAQKVKPQLSFFFSKNSNSATKVSLVEKCKFHCSK